MKCETTCLSLCLAVGLALAAVATLAVAEPDRIKLEAKVPEFKVHSVRPSPVPGLWEVAGTRGELLYVDDATNVAILGNMVDIETGRNLTVERLGLLHSVDFDTLPLALAIKRVHGDGSRRLAIFSDPDCPYCRQLEQSLVDINNVTVYLFLYPLTGLHPGAAERAHRIWCAENPAEAWNAWMLKEIQPPERQNAACVAPLDAIATSSVKAWVNGTPGLVFGSGRTFSGMMAAEDLERYLAEPKLPAAAAAIPKVPG